MVTYALDASAMLRLLDNHSGSLQVEEIINGHLNGMFQAAMLTIHVGEVASRIYRDTGEEGWHRTQDRIAGLDLKIIPITADFAIRCGILKVKHKLPYGCFWTRVRDGIGRSRLRHRGLRP